MTVQARLFSLALLAGVAATLPAPAADAPATGYPLPRGVADAAGKVGYVAQAKGGVAAIDLQTGKALWTNKDVTRPLAVVGNRLAAFALVKDKPTALRVVFLDVTAEGKRLKESEPIDFPDWSAPGQGFDDQEAGKSFSARASAGSGELLLRWEAHAHYFGGAAPTPEILEAAKKDEARVARINLESGKVTTGPAEKPTDPAPLAPAVEKLIGAREWSVGPFTVIGERAFGGKLGARTGGRFGGASEIVLEAVDLKTGKLLWDVVVGEKRFLPLPP